MLMPLLRLLRLPALFTTFPDVLAGYAVVGQGKINPAELALVLLASGLLYLSGMVLNDFFDVIQDTAERPSRPIPAGEISRSTAGALGFLLMLGGIVCAAMVCMAAAVVAVALAVLILAYDAGGKKTILGPMLMGLCRSSNLLLGAAAFGSDRMSDSPLPLILAGLIGLYVVGITVFARSEALESGTTPLRLGSGILLLAIIGWIMTAATFAQPTMLRFVAVMFVLIVFQLSRRILPALRTGTPRLVQQAVRTMLLTIPMLEAIAIVAHGGPNSIPLAIAAALLMLPGQILSRFIPMT